MIITKLKFTYQESTRSYWLIGTTASESCELNLLIQFPFKARLIPLAIIEERMEKESRRVFEVFCKHSSSARFLFNYGEMFVVYISEEELNWRMKYLMIYLTKQIVQLLLGFTFPFVPYTQTSFAFSFYFGVHADILLQIVQWSVKTWLRTFAPHQPKRKILNSLKRFLLICLVMFLLVFTSFSFWW